MKKLFVFIICALIIGCSSKEITKTTITQTITPDTTRIYYADTTVTFIRSAPPNWKPDSLKSTIVINKDTLNITTVISDDSMQAPVENPFAPKSAHKLVAKTSVNEPAHTDYAIGRDINTVKTIDSITIKPIPWYLEPLDYLRGITQWIIIAIIFGIVLFLLYLFKK